MLFNNLTPLIPLSLLREGGQGDRLLKNFKEVLIYAILIAYTIFKGK
jgi:hypothetical protein